MAYFTASCDTAETNKRFAESMALDYPILSDPTGATAKAYGVYQEQAKLASRWTFYIGKDGKILFTDRSPSIPTPRVQQKMFDAIKQAAA